MAHKTKPHILRLNYKTARTALGKSTRHGPSRRGFLKTLGTRTTLEWACADLEENLKAMFLHWRESARKAPPGVSRVSLMIVACSKAFGIGQRDLIAPIRDSVIVIPRLYAMAMLYGIGYPYDEIGRGFGRSHRTVQDSAGYWLSKMGWLKNEDLSGIGFTLIGRTKRPVSLGFLPKVRPISSERKTSGGVDCGGLDGG